uniref:Uncharacterized protein n=1 Tax=Candidatus Kentrum sp. FW TaxID=2126338 RepID=A0A450T7M3_9GAMM|nr:MAG: hypothetical protein BECKFW1821C_GA0114237_10033 [Candidatus Kentron sp. FW]
MEVGDHQVIEAIGPIGVGVMGILEEFIDGGGDAGDLLPPQHVHRANTGFELGYGNSHRYFYRSLLLFTESPKTDLRPALFGELQIDETGGEVHQLASMIEGEICFCLGAEFR